MPPSSASKMKIAGADVDPFETWNSALPAKRLNTAPVGALSGGMSVPMLTTSGSGAPVLPLYSVDTLVPLSATHHGLPLGDAASPHALTRFGSVNIATPGWFETRFVTV